MNEIQKLTRKRLIASANFEEEYLKYSIKNYAPFYKRWIIRFTLWLYDNIIKGKIIRVYSAINGPDIIIDNFYFPTNIVEIKIFDKRIPFSEFHNYLNKNKRIVKRILKN